LALSFGEKTGFNTVQLAKGLHQDTGVFIVSNEEESYLDL
jgi:hypothetical protein